METAPRRTIRKLADLGRVCAKGTVQKEMFSTFQRLLRSPESPYFHCVEELIKQVDQEALTTFGINLGYNGWTYGVRKIRSHKGTNACTSWIFLLNIDKEKGWNTKNLKHFVSQGKSLGVYTYAILPDTPADAASMLAPVFEEHADCVFLWFLPPSFVWESRQNFPCFYNVMPLFSRSTLEDSACISHLKENRSLYGIYHIYNEQTEEEAISKKNLDLLSSFGTPFLFYMAENKKSDQNSVVSRFAMDARMKQAYPFVLIDFYSDIVRIDRIISGDSHSAVITEPPHRVLSSALHQ